MEAGKTKRTKSTKSATTKTNTRSRTKKQAVTQEDIARRAYEIYLSRGAVKGSELEDWIQAEKELLKKKK
ncbi:DUF2934 domain-containing protein [bacterium]|nr:DUF2934 domain-containing protein [bacterium]